MKKIIINIGGMSCSACSNHIEKYVSKQDGIKSISVNLVLGQALIEYEDKLNIKDIEKYIKDSGYDYLGIYNEKDYLKKEKKNKKHLIILIILGIILMYISMASMLNLPIINTLSMNNPINYGITLFILSIPFLVIGFDILKNGIKNLINKSPNMDSLVSLGVICSFLYSTFSLIMILFGKTHYVHNLYFESSAIVILFIKIGRYIEKENIEKTKDAIKELVTVTPDSALIKKGNEVIKTTIDLVNVGDTLVVLPGMKVAVDGTITNGKAHFDESFITGESIPKTKELGEKILAGSLNIDGNVEYKAEKIGVNSTISEIVRIVTNAINTKTPISRFADKVSSYFVPTIIIISILTFIIRFIITLNFSESLISLVTVLVVACPCALGLATPLSIVMGTSLCTKNGILVKSSETLENARNVDTIVFDKTGTLTYGDLKISKIYNYSNKDDDEIIKIIASVETNSTHPISKSFCNLAKDLKLELFKTSDFKNITGIGLFAKINKKNIYIGNNKLFKKLNIENKYKEDEEKLTKLGNSIVYLIEDKTVLALIGVKDIVRDNVSNVIKRLKNLNKEVIMLTGDNETTANLIAKSIGINEIYADISPIEKSNIIKKLVKNNKKVMMIGDGINDSPALVNANIGVSMNSGTDIAASSSSVILMNDNLESILTLIKISERTIKNIKENLFWAFFYNILMIPIAAGLLIPFKIKLNPMIASLSMMISSITVVLNSLRLKNVK